MSPVLKTYLNALRDQKYQQGYLTLRGPGFNTFSALGLLCEVAGQGHWYRYDGVNWAYTEPLRLVSHRIGVSPEDLCMMCANFWSFSRIADKLRQSVLPMKVLDKRTGEIYLCDARNGGRINDL